MLYMEFEAETKKLEMSWKCLWLILKTIFVWYICVLFYHPKLIHQGFILGDVKCSLKNYICLTWISFLLLLFKYITFSLFFSPYKHKLLNVLYMVLKTAVLTIPSWLLSQTHRKKKETKEPSNGIKTRSSQVEFMPTPSIVNHGKELLSIVQLKS